MKKLRILVATVAVALAGRYDSVCQGQQLYRIHAFEGGSEGTFPITRVAPGNNSYYYGTTSQGGTNNDGTVYAVSSLGTFSTVYQFSGSDGKDPGGLTSAGGDVFWGTTS